LQEDAARIVSVKLLGRPEAESADCLESARLRTIQRRGRSE
jgi:hypothetical protein